ncbi:MAG TPA: SpoVR family protein [Candidatus Krumholzibacteria bacterium]|nr:SpoVR family protein [Candidatus Krumholzibacteria bacterium]HPD72266.1 SpoVR family protein [Candidatus Krumholzibacteria bacterium]HRY40802.1 SpoVR family protein [Candidatus Krumholzibacteria bacterium]
MQLIDQHAKRIMEGCKERARDAGLRFDDETLEYVVTNRDLVELSPKVMIPTLYDYWVHDLEVLQGRGRYELYPSNPYETVINTRPAISFYNDNNPDWLNVMIFYHVLGHIDFFQNNLFFRHTWDDDFAGQALANKRALARLRSEHGRWVDYVIEFARAMDNLVDFHGLISDLYRPPRGDWSRRLDWYFDVFLQEIKQLRISDYVKEVTRFNECQREAGTAGEDVFFKAVQRKYPEFAAMYERSGRTPAPRHRDVMQFVLDHSRFLNQEENKWMQQVVQIVRQTSLYFQPQIRTKIMNEGWSSYWHETLFMRDDRIAGHEVDFARVNAAVTSMPRIGLNPYALGMRLFYWIEAAADKGRYSRAFLSLLDADRRRRFDRKSGAGREYLFAVRENLNDYLFASTFLEQDFVDAHKLFVADRRLDESRLVWQWYVKSRSADQYKQMVLDQLYHPPHVTIDVARTRGGALHLVHHFEGKPLVREFVQNTLLGIEYLWGNPVVLETSEVESIERPGRDDGAAAGAGDTAGALDITWARVRYTMKDRQLEREVI